MVTMDTPDPGPALSGTEWVTIGNVLINLFLPISCSLETFRICSSFQVQLLGGAFSGARGVHPAAGRDSLPGDRPADAAVR